MIYVVVDQRPGKRARYSYGNTVPGGWICTRNVALDFIGGTASMSLQDAELGHSPTVSPEGVDDIIHKILDRHRDKIRTLVTKAGRQPLLPPWIPTTGNGETAFKNYMEMLKIPSIRNTPSLLLHDLGSESSVISRNQAECITKIFSHHDHMCVDNYDSLRPVD